MAPVIKWQRWDNVSYNWFGAGATDALPSLEAEIDAWITAVNSNASNVGRQITKERGYADSTGGNYAAFVLSAGANGNASKGYLQWGCLGSTSSKKAYAGPTFADDTSNGGYGTVSGGSSDTSIGWVTSGQEANWLIVYDVTDGEEYFAFGPAFDSNDTGVQEGFSIVKCTDGEWSLVANDSSSFYHMHYWDDGGTFVGWSNCTRGTDVTASDRVEVQGTYSVGRWSLEAGSGSADSNIDSPPNVYAANALLLQPSSSSNYYYTGHRRILTDVGDGTNVYILNTSYYGPSVLIDLRP